MHTLMQDKMHSEALFLGKIRLYMIVPYLTFRFK